MFGFKIIKSKEIKKLKSDLEALELELEDANETIEAQAKDILKLLDTIKNQDSIIANLTKNTTTDSDVQEEKPVKKVRRKTTKKINKKED